MQNAKYIGIIIIYNVDNRASNIFGEKKIHSKNVIVQYTMNYIDYCLLFYVLYKTNLYIFFYPVNFVFIVFVFKMDKYT